jgi:hypothetical protein
MHVEEIHEINVGIFLLINSLPVTGYDENVLKHKQK